MVLHTRSAFTIALAVAATVAAGPVAAAPTDIARAPDLTFEPCQQRGMPPFEGLCPVLGYGDLNGDGQADVVVEQIPDKQAPGLPGVPEPRTFLLLVSPFQAPDGPSKRIQVRIARGEGDVNLTIADVNGDGMDDVAFASLYRDLSSRVLMGHQRVALVMGRASFAARYELGRLDGTVSTLRRTLAGTDIDTVGQVMLDDVRVAFGDVNGDGSTDVVLGNGTAGDPLGQALGPIVEPARPADDPTAAPAAASVAVAFGPIRWDGSTVLTPDVGIARLGPCSNALGGVVDVTGDGVDDVVFTRCPGKRLPDAVDVLPGSPAMAAAAWRTASEDPITLPRLGWGRADTDVPPPGEPGRGYIGGSAGPDPSDRPLFFDDVDADGVRDIVLGFGTNAHVWLGGGDIAARLAARRTDRVIVGAGFGALARTRGWHGADMDGDGARDLLLVHPPRPVAASASGAPIDPASAARVRVEIYAGARAAVDVLDTDLDAPDAIWQPALLSLDGMADIDGDGLTDLVWSAPSKAGPSLSIHYGPLFGR